MPRPIPRRTAPIVLALMLTAMASPAAADPITFPFATKVTQAFGPLEAFFGRTFVRGDDLTGRFIFDPASIGGDLDARPDKGLYRIASGRIELDVPSGFAVDTRDVNWLDGSVENSAPGALDYVVVEKLDQRADGFISSRVGWLDYRGTALSNARFPSSVAGFDNIELRLTTFGMGSAPVTLYGDAGIAVTPEPASMILFATGLAGAGLLTRRRRRE